MDAISQLNAFARSPNDLGPYTCTLSTMAISKFNEFTRSYLVPTLKCTQRSQWACQKQLLPSASIQEIRCFAAASLDTVEVSLAKIIFIKELLWVATANTGKEQMITLAHNMSWMSEIQNGGGSLSCDLERCFKKRRRNIKMARHWMA